METQLFVLVIKRRGDCPFNQRACIITTLIKAAKSLRCHLSSRKTGRIRFWLIPPCECVKECVWVYDCPKDKSWQLSKECKTHNCTLWVNRLPYSVATIFEQLNHFPLKTVLYFRDGATSVAHFSILLYLSQWLMSRCGWFKCSLALHDVMVSLALTAACWQRPVQQKRIFPLVQKLLSVIKSLNTSNKKKNTPLIWSTFRTIVTRHMHKLWFHGTENVTTGVDGNYTFLPFYFLHWGMD